MKPVLLDFSLEEILPKVENLGLPKYKAAQIFQWLMKDVAFENMTNIGKEQRQLLADSFIDRPAQIIQELKSKDGTVKYLFRLQDGNIVEGVLMRYQYGNTICVSTQAGCRMGCVFCASTLGGLVRNLTAGEILGQVTAVNAATGGTLDKREVTNIVLMGSGEPLDNYDNVTKFLRLVNDERGIGISLRNISLSTCGLTDGILRLAKENLPVNLTISLHSPFDESRSALMPVNRRHSIAEVICAAKTYFDATGRRVIFEYTLISGQNDRPQDADKLASLLKGFSTHVNLIRLNPVKERNLSGTTEAQANAFLKLLQDKGVSATLRRQMGNDIEGACGQLRRKFVGEK